MKSNRFAFFLTLPCLLLLGVLAGVLNGLLGAGGGILLVLGLRTLLGGRVADTKRIYTTATAVMLPISLLSAWQYLQNGHLAGGDVFPLLLPAALGGVLGAWLLRCVTPKVLARLFAIVVLVSGIVLVI